MSAVRLLLSALRRPLLVHTYRSLPHRRQFSFTAWPRATETKVTPPQNANPGLDEVPQEILGEIPQEVHEEMRELGTAYSAQIQKLLESPEALNALKDLKRSVESLGIDLRESEHLGTMQVMKLAANSQIREAGRRVMVEMEKAGVDLSKMEEIMWAMQQLEPDEDDESPANPNQ